MVTNRKFKSGHDARSGHTQLKRRVAAVRQTEEITFEEANRSAAKSQGPAELRERRWRRSRLQQPGTTARTVSKLHIGDLALDWLSTSLRRDGDRQRLTRSVGPLGCSTNAQL